MLVKMETGGSGGSTLRDIIKNKAFNGGYTEICTFSPYDVGGSRCIINEAKAVVDTINHKVYIYIDLNTLMAYEGGGWVQIININNLSDQYLPIYDTSSRNYSLPLITDEESSNPLLQWAFGYISSYGMRVYTGYDQKFNSGERYIIYTAYSYK